MRIKVKFNSLIIIVLIIVSLLLFFFTCYTPDNPLRIGYWDQSEWDNCAWGD